MFCSGFLEHSSIYDIEVKTLDDKTISFESFRGSKIMIAVFNAAAPDKEFLLMLESIKKSNKNVYLLAVPATDFGGDVNKEKLSALKSSLKLNYDIAAPVEAKKNGSSRQNALFKWLTHADDNSHFDGDIEADQQIFVISESGALYSSIGKGTSKKMIEEVIAQNIKE